MADYITKTEAQDLINTMSETLMTAIESASVLDPPPDQDIITQDKMETFVNNACTALQIQFVTLIGQVADVLDYINGEVI